MKKTFNKIIGVAAVVVASVFMSSSAMAWGPERTTFTMDEPATYPTFNSITDNPTIGDERNFVRIGEINTDETKLRDEVEIVPGKEYLVYIYVHNNASSTFNDSAHGNAGVAIKTTLASSFSKVLTPEKSGQVTATVSASNSNPASVWDEAKMTTKANKVTLRYVAGSAKIYNDWKLNGSGLAESLFTETGVLLGLNDFNGLIPGCEEYHSIIKYVLLAEELDGSIEKTVSIDGSQYGDTTNAVNGDKVYFKLDISNTGDLALSNAVLKDTLPDGLVLDAGSVKLTANDSGVMDNLSDELVAGGYNLGTIGTGNKITIYYTATVNGNFNCDGTALENTATLIYDSEVPEGDRRSDTAKVYAQKQDCDTPPTPEPEETCATNPNLPGCKELPKTGPAEVAMAVAVAIALGGGIFYLVRTRRTLKTVEGAVTGDKAGKTEDGASQDPDNMVK